MSIRDIARTCEVDESTVYQWQQSDNFCRCLRIWKFLLFDDVDRKMKTVYPKAVDRLEAILDDQSTDKKNLLKAIEIVLKTKK